MREGGPPDFFEDPLGPDDSAARDREQRRAQREHRRRQQTDPAGPPAPAADPPAAPAADPPPERPVNPVSTRPAGPPPGDAGRRLRAIGGRLRDPDGRARGIAIAALLVVTLAVLWFLWALFQPFHGDGHGKVVVSIPKGASAADVGDILDDRGVVSSSALFQIRAKLSGQSDEILPGGYTLAADMSYGAALDALTRPPSLREITLTIPEGLSGKQIAPLVEQAGVSGDYEAASRASPLLNPKFYGAKSADSLEGFLFPATYELRPGGTAQQLVRKQLQAFKQRIATVPMRYARSKNLNTYDVLTIASMVEREVQVPRERPLVAAVIYNRLRDGMPLGIDATVRYATDNHTEPLTTSELNSNSPYNTRKFAGLPPGPIGNPGLDSIRAAAKPARVPYLFFVVKPGSCGEHSFATTDAQFQRAQARYNAAREAAGGQSPTSCPGQ